MQPDLETSDPFVEGLDMLFEHVRHPTELGRDGRHRKWKATELAAALGVSDAYVSKLRKGRTNPPLALIQGIAAFFEVSGAVLVDDDPQLREYVSAQLDLYSALIEQDLPLAEAKQLLRAPSAEPPAVIARLLDTRQRYRGSSDTSDIAPAAREWSPSSVGPVFREPLTKGDNLPVRADTT
ncbi:helix-turn-helix domain-containing protein [Amycolatopsis sp. cmx-4-54]|uniref:helix-turn-helix domain-containing protein n=1 Tax=Amycolatopsis sp. cmx-4-54 TaxID=2790936 RepID=UPI00397C2B99